jgi:hypothetical protein
MSARNPLLNYRDPMYSSKQLRANDVTLRGGATIDGEVTLDDGITLDGIAIVVCSSRSDHDY